MFVYEYTWVLMEVAVYLFERIPFVSVGSEFGSDSNLHKKERMLLDYLCILIIRM